MKIETDTDKEILNSTNCPYNCQICSVIGEGRNKKEDNTYYVPFGEGGFCTCPEINETYCKYKICSPTLTYHLPQTQFPQKSL